MNGELLVAWMAHIGSGTWSAFCASVRELSGTMDEELSRLCKSLRILLSELGYAEFYVGGTRRWRVYAPALAGLSRSSAALLIGGRSPKSLEALRSAVGKVEGATIEEEELPFGLRRMVTSGTEDNLGEIARLVGIPYIPNMSLRLVAAERPLIAVVLDAPRYDEPVNWESYSWDFEISQWVPGRRSNTARRYIDRFRRMTHLVHSRREGLRLLGDPFVAVFGAAASAGIRLVEYDTVAHVLKLPRTCPLPGGFSKAACLAGGRPSRGDENKLIYNAVPPGVALLMLTRLGQPLPDRFLNATDGRS
jgi:hypothetical protein